jgi:hypothetical protein
VKLSQCRKRGGGLAGYISNTLAAFSTNCRCQWATISGFTGCSRYTSATLLPPLSNSSTTCALNAAVNCRRFFIVNPPLEHHTRLSYLSKIWGSLQIVRDAQGLQGKKVEIYSLPYSSIVMWSSENAGGFLDYNAEIELWTKAGQIKVNLGKGIDIRRFDKLIAGALL